MSTDISLDTEYPEVTMDDVDHLFDEEGSIIVGEKRMLLLGRAEVHAEGLHEGILASIKKLMIKMGLSAAEAMNVLDIPEAERQSYIDRIAEPEK